MTERLLDILDSLCTLDRATAHELQDHTGRTLKSVRQALPELAELGHARRTGRRKRRSGETGQPQLRWAPTASGRERVA